MRGSLRKIKRVVNVVVVGLFFLVGASVFDFASASETQAPSAADKQAVEKIIADVKQHVKPAEQFTKVADSKGMMSIFLTYGALFTVLIIAVALTVYFSRDVDEKGESQLKMLLGTKIIMSFSGLILMMAALGTYSVVSMKTIGTHVEEMAEEIIPVLNTVANTETHQFQQVIALERLFRFGDQEGPHAKEQVVKAFGKYKEMGAKVEKDISDILNLLDKVPAQDAEDAEEMTHIVNVLNQIQMQHTMFDELGGEIFNLLQANEKNQAHLLEQYVEGEAEKLGHELETLLITLEERIDLVAHETEELEHKAVTRQTLLMLISMIIGFIAAIYLTLRITQPIKKAVAFSQIVASGDISKKLDHNSSDEIGVLAAALNVMTANLKEMMIEIREGAVSLSSSSEKLSATSTQMSANAEQTSGKAGTVAAAAEEMSVNMNSVAAAAEQAATNVNIVAAAAEEMTSTVAEIASNTEKTSDMTSQAVTQAATASEKVHDLGDAAVEISKVTETITEISEQTNLLALNATIEAARAGEAGKGFAVVANEIKELAKQTAEATLEIKKKIEGVQSSTKSTVDEITEITQVINEVNSMTNTIAVAIEEQSAATQEIAGNVAQASLGIQEVTENVAESSTVSRDIAQDVAEIDQAATELTDSSTHVHSNADELNDFATKLNSMVGNFKV